MGRQKVTVKSRRETRKESRSKGRNTGEVISMYPEDHDDNRIGMLKEKYDRSPLVPRNENQRLYLEALMNQPVTVATGEAGTGKTFLSTAHAADLLLEKEVDHIIVTRPVLTAEEDMGFLPGDIMEKFMPFFRPVYDVLKKRLGQGFLKYCLRPEIEKIEIAPFSYMRGRTFENAVVILDEAQNVTASQMKLFLTRIGEDTTVIINGDVKQCDLPKHIKSGLVDLLERIEKRNLNIPVIRFEEEDCVRSLTCSLALEIYREE